MAQTTTTTLDEVTYTEIIEESIMDALRAEYVFAPTLRQFSLEGKASDTIAVPKWPTLTAAAVTETQDLTSTAIDTTEVTAQVAEVGILAEVTDYVKEDTFITNLADFARIMALAIRDKIDSDIAMLFVALNGGTKVGNVATDMTASFMLAAIQVLQANNAPAPYVCGLHPVQVGHARTNIAGLSGQIYGNISPEDIGVKGAGFAFHLYGVDFYQSTNVDSETTDTCYDGGMYSKNYALGMVTKRAIKVALQRDESKRSTEVVVTSRYKVFEVQDKAGVCIQSDT